MYVWYEWLMLPSSYLTAHPRVTPLGWKPTSCTQGRCPLPASLRRGRSVASSMTPCQPSSQVGLPPLHFTAAALSSVQGHSLPDLLLDPRVLTRSTSHSSGTVARCLLPSPLPARPPARSPRVLTRLTSHCSGTAPCCLLPSPLPMWLPASTMSTHPCHTTDPL